MFCVYSRPPLLHHSCGNPWRTIFPSLLIRLKEGEVEGGRNENIRGIIFFKFYSSILNLFAIKGEFHLLLDSVYLPVHNYSAFYGYLIR